MDFSFIKDFSQVNLLVAGEVGIDEYIWGDTRRISPEAPVPVVEVDSQTYNLGLAANVAHNIASLGGRASVVSVRGADPDGVRLAEMMGSAGIGNALFVDDPSRPTSRKVRVIAQKQQLLRVDYERSHALEAKLAREFTDRICDNLPSCDGMIVQDYGKGLWKTDTMSFLKEARARKKPVFVDPSRTSPLSLYRGVTLLTPNLQEAELLCGLPAERSQAAKRDEDRLQKMATQILRATEAEHSIITCGEWGMVSVSRGEEGLRRIPTFARDVFDVTGAGDTVIAVLAMMLLLGHPLARCMQVANAAAGIVVGHIGAASVSPDELRAELERLREGGLLSP